MESSFRGAYDDKLVRRIVDAVKNLGFQGKVCVGMDTRPSSPSLASMITSTLLSNGNTVHNLGVVPTPVLSYYTKINSCLGIMITASHNPEEDNGIKLFFNGMEAIDVKYSPPLKPSSRVINVDVRQSYISAVLQYRKVSHIQQKQPKVVVDCGNGTASLFTPIILRAVGAKVVTLNADVSHPFSRNPEPEGEALSYLPAFIREVGADFAIAHDVDADRCRIVTAEGVMSQDVQLLNIASALCSKGDTFITTVEASQLVCDELARRGVHTKITPVGSNFVARAAVLHSARFGGEPCGEYVFSDFLLSADGILSALMLAEIYCEREGFAKYTPYAIIRGKVEVASGKSKLSVVDNVKKKILHDPNVKLLSEEDGILFNYKNVRVLVRGSNTQDIIRITCEHKEEENAKYVYEWIKKIIDECNM